MRGLRCGIRAAITERAQTTVSRHTDVARDARPTGTQGWKSHVARAPRISAGPNLPRARDNFRRGSEKISDEEKPRSKQRRDASRGRYALICSSCFRPIFSENSQNYLWREIMGEREKNIEGENIYSSPPTFYQPHKVVYYSVDKRSGHLTFR